jgi:hypothetical protein
MFLIKLHLIASITVYVATKIIGFIYDKDFKKKYPNCKTNRTILQKLISQITAFILCFVPIINIFFLGTVLYMANQPYEETYKKAVKDGYLIESEGK